MRKRTALIKFGQHLRRMRLEKNWTQAEVAERALLSANYYGAIERGEKNISLLNLMALAKTFKVSLSHICDYQ